MYISTVHLLSTSGLDYLRELRSQILFESERTPGFEPGSTGCELGVVPRRHRGRWEEIAEKYVFIFNLQYNGEKRVNCPKCNHIASSNVGLKNSKITPVHSAADRLRGWTCVCVTECLNTVLSFFFTKIKKE
jgi:hypothetical protein